MSSQLFYSEAFYKAYDKTLKECERHNIEYMLSEHLLYNCLLMAEVGEKIVTNYSISILDSLKLQLKRNLDEHLALFSITENETIWRNSAYAPEVQMVGEYELDLGEQESSPVITPVLMSPMLQLIHANSAKTNNTQQSPLITLESFVAQVMEADTLGSYILKKAGVESKVFHESSVTLTEENQKESISSQLHKYCENLYQNTIAVKRKYLYRNTELNKLAEIFSRKERNNALIVGDSGAGKTALIEQVILQMEQRLFHSTLNKAQVLSLDMNALVAGTKYRGEFEERMDMVVKEFINSKKNIILVLENIHLVVGSGSSSGMDMAHFIKPLLNSSHIRVVGTTYQEEWRQIIESQNGLARYFEPVTLPNLSLTETISILKDRVDEFSTHHRVTYSEVMINKAAELSSKFLIKKPQPSAALDLLDQVGSKVARNVSNKKGEPKVTEVDLVDAVSEMAKIPALKIVQNENERILLLKDKLNNQVIGQSQAMDKLFQSIVIAKSGLREENKTLSTFLFIGMTGVGKTEAAKTIASELEIPLLRFDMSEYIESHSISKLIGAPAGYIGYGKGGLLSEAIEENPYSVILIDELEKANAEIYNLFLQIMDNGFFRDAQGRLINCQHTLFIMTSNLGAKVGNKKNVGLQSASQAHKQKEEVEDQLKPEMLNRFDAIVYFNELGLEELSLILDKQIVILNNQLKKHNIKVVLSETASKYIVGKAHLQKMGARPIKRIIEDKIKQPIALEILKKTSKENVVVEISGDDLVIA